MLEIHLLGELKVLMDGRAMDLPASKKTRALLGYLVATGKAHLRETLCELLWAGPDDPRASLRWSLTKIRPLVDQPKISRLLADRERIAFEAKGAQIDLWTLRDEIGADPTRTSTDTLRRAAARFEGELLAGLDLPDCYRYHEWCIAEREATRRQRTQILAILVARLSDAPEDALGFARERVKVDPLVEAAHVDVVRLLTVLGRRREALQQFEACRRLLANELGTKPSVALLQARLSLGDPEPAKLGATVSKPGPSMVTPGWPVFGRAVERAEIERSLREAADGQGRGMTLFLGEPGIGKTRLLEELAIGARGLGGSVLLGRAYEAEMVRPYGAWTDALRSAALGELPGDMKRDLTPLLPELGSHGEPERDRSRLFDAVTKLLAHLSATSNRPIAVILDDIQWFDEASTALLHFVVRGLGPSRVIIACGARPQEVTENVAVSRLLRTLSRERRVRLLRLAPLDADATARIAAAIEPRIDATRVASESAGNPLFAVEMARALVRGETRLSDSLADLIEDRLARIDDATRDLLPWAAALGRSFTLAALERVTRLPAIELFRALRELEQRSIITASASNEGYDFVHDLVRAAAYRGLSEPRRRLIHAQIAQVLEGSSGTDAARNAEVARHAALAGDGALAARASLAAAEACLRLFANEEAARIADAGMQYADGLDRDARITLKLGLVRVLVRSGRWAARRHVLGDQAFRLSCEARDAGIFAEAAQGFYTLSILQHDGGDFEGAHASTILAEAVGRETDPLTCAQVLSKSAQCLAHLDRDMGRAAAMASEAAALAEQAGKPELLYLFWADALLHAYRGDYPASFAAFERTLVMARREQDHYAEFECLARITLLHLEQGNHAKALSRSVELADVAAKMGEGSERPVAEALEAYARCAVGEANGELRLERALTTLREVDVKGMLASVLIFAAALDLGGGRPERAERRAEEALGAAEALKRPSAVAVARAMLARVALARGERGRARAHLRAVQAEARKPFGVSAWARAEVSRVAERLARTT
jgi:predicted ATPase/DNA-binding SARP family transcriptional activator